MDNIDNNCNSTNDYDSTNDYVDNNCNSTNDYDSTNDYNLINDMIKKAHYDENLDMSNNTRDDLYNLYDDGTITVQSGGTKHGFNHISDIEYKIIKIEDISDKINFPKCNMLGHKYLIGKLDDLIEIRNLMRKIYTDIGKIMLEWKYGYEMTNEEKKLLDTIHKIKMIGANDKKLMNSQWRF